MFNERQHLSGISTLSNRLLKEKKKQKTGRSGITAIIRAKNPPLWFHHPTRRALKQLRLPVAVDGDDDDEQHGHDDSGDDDVERQIVLLFVLHRAHDPLAFAKLDLCTDAEWKRDGDDTHRLDARWAPRRSSVLLAAGAVSRRHGADAQKLDDSSWRGITLRRGFSINHHLSLSYN